MTEVPAGDIAAVAKLADTTTGDVLGGARRRRRRRAVRGARAGARDRDPSQVEERRGQARERAAPPARRGSRAAARAQRGDPPDVALGHGRDAPRHRARRACTRKLGVEVETEDVKVAYRETITETAEAEGKYKKQTGGHGQFGVAFVRVEPLERGGGFEFVDAIVGGAIPRQFIPAVEKGVARDDGARAACSASPSST